MATILKAGNVASGAQITSDATGILEIRTGTGAGTTAITVGTDQAVTFAAGTTVSSLTTSGAVSAGSLTVNSNNISAVNSLGFRNRIINGDMRIDQRNDGASVTSTSDTYSLDRWMAQSGGAATSKYSVQRVSDAPAGFVNSLKVTSLSAYSVLTNDYADINQRVEGFNIADLAWGTASAQAVTLSFWVKSSLTGTFGGSIRGASFSRSYPFSYTVSSANTWEYKTVTIPGDTSGSWTTNNGVGLQLAFGLGNGSTYTGTAGSWASSSAIQPTSTVSVIGTNGATFYITGVQLEAGSVATPFERRDYGRELAMCQRYYWRGNASADGTGWFYGVSGTVDSTGPGGSFPVTMRVNPTSGTIAVAPTYNSCTNYDLTFSKDSFIHRLTPTSNPGVYRAYGGQYAFSAEL